MHKTGFNAIKQFGTIIFYIEITALPKLYLYYGKISIDYIRNITNDDLHNIHFMYSDLVAIKCNKDYIHKFIRALKALAELAINSNRN